MCFDCLLVCQHTWKSLHFIAWGPLKHICHGIVLEHHLHKAVEFIIRQSTGFTESNLCTQSPHILWLSRMSLIVGQPAHCWIYIDRPLRHRASLEAIRHEGKRIGVVEIWEKWLQRGRGKVPACLASPGAHSMPKVCFEGRPSFSGPLLHGSPLASHVYLAVAELIIALVAHCVPSYQAVPASCWRNLLTELAFNRISYDYRWDGLKFGEISYEYRREGWIW